MLVLLGPTATGKTALAAQVAFELNGEVLSADSRQVFRGMDIGTGKDYGDYLVKGTKIPVHLVDIADPGYEYNIYEYQQDFRKAYDDIMSRGKTPVLCGGSGMYLEAVLKDYRLPGLENDNDLLASLEQLDDAALEALLRSLKPLHNTTDLENRERMIWAIRVAKAGGEVGRTKYEGRSGEGVGPWHALVFGISLPRETVRQRITERLDRRLEEGMIEEVERLLSSGISAERLMRYGLEYRFVTLFLAGQLGRQEMRHRLNTAIHQFAKRQMTWFRRMERQGTVIHWIDGTLPAETRIALILEKYTQWNRSNISGSPHEGQDQLF